MMDGLAIRPTLVNKNKLLDIPQHVSEIGPARGVALPLVVHRGVLQKGQGIGQLIRGRRPSKGQFIHPTDALLGCHTLLGQHALGPRLGLLFDERIVHQDQCLSRHIGDVAPSGWLRWNRNIERQHHWRQKISANRCINAAASGAVERATARSSAASHE